MAYNKCARVLSSAWHGMAWECAMELTIPVTKMLTLTRAITVPMEMQAFKTHTRTPNEQTDLFLKCNAGTHTSNAN
jgi:hypothetical protein